MGGIYNFDNMIHHYIVCLILTVDEHIVSIVCITLRFLSQADVQPVEVDIGCFKIIWNTAMVNQATIK